MDMESSAADIQGCMKGKVALVTGAGKGKTVGYGCAEAFARAGADVVVAGHSSSKLKAACELERYGVRVLPVVADGADFGQVQRAVSSIEETFGHIDVLVNCAQAAKSGVAVQDLSFDDISLAISTGLEASFNWMRACYPLLSQSQGSVVNFVSRAGMEGQQRQAPLAVAKEGLRALSRVAANEWRAQGVCVNCMCALARTSQFEQWAREFEAAYSAMLEELPDGGLASIDAVGEACVRLALGQQTGKTYLVTAAGAREL